MKFLSRIFLIILMFSGTNALTQESKIFAEVSGDTVTLWETGAWRNCGAMYAMSVDREDYHIDWYQLDTGLTAVCMCYFDLSVTYGPLEAGLYNVDVYYTEAWGSEDTIYSGSTSFVIDSACTVSRSGIINQYQSDCYNTVGLDHANETDDPDLIIFPVPVKTGQVIHIKGDELREGAILEVFSVSGWKVFMKEYTKGIISIDIKVNDDIVPGPGIYLFKISTAGNVQTKIIPVL